MAETPENAKPPFQRQRQLRKRGRPLAGTSYTAEDLPSGDRRLLGSDFGDQRDVKDFSTLRAKIPSDRPTITALFEQFRPKIFDKGPKIKPVPAAKPQQHITPAELNLAENVAAVKLETNRPPIAPKPDRLSAPSSLNTTPRKSVKRNAPAAGSAAADGITPSSSDGTSSLPHNNETDQGEADGVSEDDWENFSEEDEFADDVTDAIYDNVEQKDPSSELADAIERELVTSPTAIGDNIIKSQKVIEEFCKTEKAYVSRLGLISEDFYNALVLTNKSDQIVNESGMQTIFGNIQSIHQFHQKFLLPELQHCSVDGQQKRALGEVMKRNAPFLKMYVVYVQNFNSAFDLIEKLKTQSIKFAKFMDNFQKLPVCDKLTIQNHMLEPVQRIPRYELLLKDYIHHLPDDSPDRTDAAEALKLVAETGVRCNEIMKDLENSVKLFDIIRSISGFDNLVKPGCALVKQGRVLTVKKRTKETHDMYIFLFSDTLLLCRVATVAIKAQYKLKTHMDVFGMKILDGEEHQMIRIHAKQKFVHLRFSSIEEREEWQTALNSIISDNERSAATRSQRPSGSAVESLVPVEELDAWAPLWLEDDVMSVCMMCFVEMTRLVRRHHCCACGAVVCGDCSTRKVALSFCGNTEKKVCNNCFTIITARRLAKEPGRFYKNRPLMEQLADISPVVEGPLLASRDRINWQKRHFAFYQPSTLCSSNDVVSAQSVTASRHSFLRLDSVLPLMCPTQPGRVHASSMTPETAIFLSEYQIKLTPETSSQSSAAPAVDFSAAFGSKYTFLLTQGKQAIYFRAQDHNDLVRWITHLQPPITMATGYR